MGKPQNKSTVCKEKSGTARQSIPANIQRRTNTTTNAARRRTTVTLVQDNNSDGLDDGDTNVRNHSTVPSNQSDMSGDDDNERSQQFTGMEKKISPTRTSMVNEFADKISPNEYKCKLCSKTYRCGTGTNANIRRHLANTHGKISLYSKSQVPRHPDSIASGRKKKLDEAAIRAIVMDSRSFGDFRRDGMQYFLRVAIPGYKGPAARTVQRNLKTLYDEKKKELKEELKKVQNVSITADTWRSGRKHHYLCVTAHFISSKYEQQGTILSFRQFHGRTFAKRLRRHIQTVLNMYDLDNGKVYVTTTDNGSDIRKATQHMNIFGIRLHCIGHGLNLVVQRSLNLWPKKNPMSRNVINTFSTTNSESNEDDENSSDLDSDEGSIVERCSNRATSDMESVDDGSDGIGDLDSADDCSDSDNDDSIVVLDIQDIGVLMVKCRKLINTIRKSSILNDAMRNLSRDSVSVELISDMKIRWNSTYKMIQRLVLYQNILGAFYDSLDTIDGVTGKQRKKLTEVKLTNADWNILLAMRRVLERFNDATEILSGKSYPTLSLAYPVIYSLNKYLNDHTGDSMENAVKEIMLDKFNEYILPESNSKHSDILVCAAFLDPLVHDMLSLEHKSRAEKILLNDVKKYQKMSTNNQNDSQSVTMPTATTNPVSLKSSTMLKKFLSKCGVASTTENVDQSRTLTIQQELARMASLPKDNQDFSVFWQMHENTMPLLAVQAKKYLAVSATSVPSESAFSISNYILRKNRMSLTSKNLKYCMFLKDKLDC